jgi:hypothetical protein
MSWITTLPGELFAEWLVVLGVAGTDYVIDMAASLLPTIGNGNFENYLVNGLKQTAGMIIFSKKDMIQMGK